MIAYNIDNASPRERQKDPLGGGYLMPGNCTDVEPPEFNKETHTCVFDGNQWVVTEIPIPEPEPTPEPIPAMEQLRMERNQLLRETDWRMTSDYPYSDQAEWASYRTALRNLPATAEPTLDEQGNLIVDWPTPPSEV